MGWDPLGDLNTGWNDLTGGHNDNPGNVFGNIAGNIVNGFTQFMTGGWAAYDPNKGKFTTNGYSKHGWDEGIGEVTGRNSQRDALNDAHNRLVAEDAARAKAVVDARQSAADMDLQRSNAAGGSRIMPGQKAGSSMNYNAMGDEKDFLGL